MDFIWTRVDTLKEWICDRFGFRPPVMPLTEIREWMGAFPALPNREGRPAENA